MTAIQAGLCAGLIAAALLLAPAGAIGAQLLSARNPAIPLPAGGNDNSVAPILTLDGRFVLFSSSASDLVPGDNDQPGLDVFLRDRASNTTALVSINLAGTGGGNGYSMPGQVSTNGRYVVFQSLANDLVSDDTNGFSDIFVRDLVAGASLLVSASMDGGAANGSSSEPVMTPDGRYVAFVSDATNLVSGDANGIQDVFVRDLIAGTTTLASPGAVPLPSAAGASMISPVITPDGRYVAFFTTATGLVSGVPWTSVAEVYVRDVVAGATTWASTNAAAIALSTFGYTRVPSYHPRLSDDGRYIAFKTGPTNGPQPVLVLRYDALTAVTATVGTNGLPAMADEDDAFGPEMTPDGRYIAFAQGDNPAGNPGYSSVRIWDSQSGTTTLVSDNGSGVPTNTFSRKPVISPDGRFVAFLSDATNLVGNAVTSGFHVYRRDLQLASTLLVDADTNGGGSADCELATLSMSDDGRFVAFSSPHGSLVEHDNNRASDVFVRDVQSGLTELVSLRDVTIVPRTGAGFSLASQLSVSADGRWVVFVSQAGDLVLNDANQSQDVFACDLLTGSNRLVSVGLDGNSALGGTSANPLVSSNGHYVFFVSNATNLVAGPVATNLNVFRHDLQTGATVLVSIDTNNLSPGNADSYDPVISADGRYVAFLSKAWNLAVTYPPILQGINSLHSYLRDVDSGLTIFLTNSTSSSVPYAPSMNSDGRFVAHYYSSTLASSRSLRVFDLQLGTDIYTNFGTITFIALSPDGGRLHYRIGNTNFVDDVHTGANLFSITSAAPIRDAAGWSADGRFLVLVSTNNLLPGDAGLNKVCLCDLTTGTISLICTNAGFGTGSFGPLSDAPIISGNGRFVLYRTAVADVVAGTNATPEVCMFDRLTGSNAVLTLGQAGTSPVVWASRPAVSATGGTVAFSSLGSGLASGDLNRAPDVFTVEIDTASALTDGDGDGIPDWWMVEHFGHETGQAGDLSRAQDDADGDSMTNLQEFLTGTDPTDESSLLKLQIAATVSIEGTSANLSWPAVAGRGYRIQYKDSLSDPVWLDAPGNALVIGSQGYHVTPANLSSRFYRVLSVN